MKYSGAAAASAPSWEVTLALVEISELDTRHFGIRSARTAKVTADALPRILDFCRDEQVAFLIARCDAADLPAARAMCAAGFDLMDTLVYVERSLSEPPPPRSPNDATLRLARADDSAIIAAIAKECFAGYFGHYHSDPRLDQAKCDGVYVSWAVRSHAKETADETFIAEVDGEIAGFLSVSGGELATAPIAGIRTELRQRGVYRTLVEEAVRWATAAGSKRMQISTAITHSVSLNTWLRTGFRTCGASYTFHKWFETDKH